MAARARLLTPSAPLRYPEKMTSDDAASIVREHLRESFGQLVAARGPELRRRAAGPVWCVPAVIVCAEGEIPVADIDVDEDGNMSPLLDVERVVTAIRATPKHKDRTPEQAAISEAESLFADIAAEAGAEQTDVESSSRRLRDLFREADEASFLEARTLLPLLLSNADHRGRVLMMMAEVERRLGQGRLALSYLEAAANEMADRYDMRLLEQAAAMAHTLLGDTAFPSSPIVHLVRRCHERLRPVDDLFDSPVLARIPDEDRAAIEESSFIRVLTPGEVLVAEGEPSTSLFLVKTGVIAVLHEKPARRLVRCCSPGSLLGESSVLVQPDPRCTATLRAEHLTEVWQIDARLIRAVMARVPELEERFVQTKKLHGLDSFFSAHGSIGQLDSEVRNELLKCLQAIHTYEERTVVIPAGSPPPAAYLVARGKVSLHDGGPGGARIGEMSADEIVGVRDILHHVGSPRTVVAEPGTTLVLFGAQALRDLAAKSAEHTVAVLERLG